MTLVYDTWLHRPCKHTASLAATVTFIIGPPRYGLTLIYEYDLFWGIGLSLNSQANLGVSLAIKLCLAWFQPNTPILIGHNYMSQLDMG